MTQLLSRENTQIRTKLIRDLNSSLTNFIDLISRLERVNNIDYRNQCRGFSSVRVTREDFHEELTELSDAYLDQLFARLLRLKAKLRSVLVNLICESASTELSDTIDQS